MNKSQLIARITDETNVSQAVAGAVLKAVIDGISSSLQKGERVSLSGFGAFSVSERAARAGRNPQTGEFIRINSQRVIKFKAGKELHELVNG